MSNAFRRTLALASVVAMCVFPAVSHAQAGRGKLMVTVTDVTGAVLPGATVTLAGLDPATRATVAPVVADAGGMATLQNLPPGRYSVEVVFPAFEKGFIKEVRVRAGDNRQTIVLKLSSLTDSVTVGRDQQEAAADRSTTFGTALTREQIDALSDDETELADQLRAMAGPDAVIRVDSFEGQQLPPKSQIKSIRITRDQFAAENHYAGGISIDIVTQPGIGPLRTNLRTGFYDSSMDGRNQLVDQRTPGQNKNYAGGISGTLIQNKSSFSLNFNGTNQFVVPVAYASTSGGTVAGNLAIRQPSDTWGLSGLVDYAITKDQTLRVGFSRNNSARKNLGLGGANADLLGGYESDNSGATFRIQESGPLGRRFFTSTRLYVGSQTTSTLSALEEPTVVILGSSTTGGAQQAGASHSKALLFGSDLDYIRGRHSVRMGLQVDGSGYRTNQQSNYLGTYTFIGLDQFNAGTPQSYTQRIGDPNIQYWNFQTGLYAQDDIKVRKNLTLTPGLRYEVQTHVPDKLNLGPRFGITYAPFKNGQTTLRASAGIFYDWLGTNTYEQTLRVDGFRQREVNIIDPTYPIDPSLITGDNALPTNRYLLADNIQLARTTRFSGGISQTVLKKLTIGLTYADSRGSGLLVGQNLNAPVDGVRPDPTFANIIRASSDGRSRQRSLALDTSLNLSRTASGPPAGGGKFFDWRRNLYLSGYYTYARFENDTDGAFSVPATNDLALEWGPAPGDVHHRSSVYISSSAIRNFSMQIGLAGSSAPPLTILTGTDDNNDSIFNDRPAGVGRNSYRTTGQWSANAYFNYSFGLGHQQLIQPGGVMITSVGGVLSASTMAAQNAPRYRVNISCQVTNLTNQNNLVGYSGVMTSTLFLQPTAVAGVRRITFSMGLQF